METIQKNTYVAIMAGGVGSRFWPASRSSYPKQFLDILGVGKSLIRLTFERFLNLCPASNIYILTNESYKSLVLEHLPELDESQILCEPSRNNTAPCIAYIAFKLRALNPAANFIVAPSDHVILKETDFLANIKQALAFTAKENALVTLGIEPTRPDTGYGYIKYDKASKSTTKKVEAFREKPDLATAKTYIKSGDFVWNAGIFIWRAATIIAAFAKYNTDIHRIFSTIEKDLNQAGEQEIINKFYPTCPSISIDYAIMEKADNVYTIPADIGWSDLGTWASLYAMREKDNEQNVLDGKMLVKNTSSSYIRLPKGKLALIKGLEDYIVVDEGNVLLIYPKSEEQDIKQEVSKMKEQFGREHF